MFDWEGFLNRNAIAYVSTGRNVRRNNISMPCPLCGDDPSENLGISLVGKGWSCWRNRNHKGIHPQPLIMVLLGCSRNQADAIVAAESTGFVTSDATFADDCFSRLGIKHEPRRLTVALELLPEFKPLHESSLAHHYAYPYLKNKRKYQYDENVDWLSKHYELQFASEGRYGYRIVFPVRRNGVLLNWTGRAVAEREMLRYKSLSDDPISAAKEDLPVAPVNIKECILDHDRLMQGGEELVVVEGPLDAARITFLGEDYGIMGAALFSKYPLPTQLDLLSQLAPKFKRRSILLDNDAFADSWFSLPDYLGFRTRILNEGDPAELTYKKFKALFNLH